MEFSPVAVLAGGEHDHRLSRLQHDAWQGPLSRRARVVGQIGTLQVDLNLTAIEELDPVRRVPVLIDQRPRVERHELRDDDATEVRFPRSFAVDHPACRNEKPSQDPEALADQYGWCLHSTSTPPRTDCIRMPYFESEPKFTRPRTPGGSNGLDSCVFTSKTAKSSDAAVVRG